MTIMFMYITGLVFALALILWTQRQAIRAGCNGFSAVRTSPERPARARRAPRIWAQGVSAKGV